MRLHRFAVLSLVLALLGGAAAQDAYAGIRSGYPLGATLHYGTAIGPAADARFSVRVTSDGGAVRAGVGVDVLSPFVVDGPVTGYYGAGPAIEIGGDRAVLDVHGLVGGEYRFAAANLPQLGLFLEGSLGARIGLGVSDASTQLPALGAALGVNWHF